MNKRIKKYPLSIYEPQYKFLGLWWAYGVTFQTEKESAQFLDHEHTTKELLIKFLVFCSYVMLFLIFINLIF